ncbi:transmembrane protein, putative (macronuclear) [Tetrahymena thermophila SB210]|uniref:Transmembrane protein, putative n=1 Tax=Tetrahymena thermophila (strain SB210) TaxID=312017 RepID=A4VDI2_TETTS|nr:transmembrane protein, putative [Tetrahymena thermophila SB210]EDK31587.2 transmembrane protein, putative [Tetrahymena thermophila SB210]|eukprot:XP_001471414.2 transmembrane protein, putative [Tetrahymena thermophila SB210]
MSRINFLLIKKSLILFLHVVTVKSIGCPFWQIGSSDTNASPIQKIILLKSNPQNQVEDIAAIVYQPFNVGIFNIQKNKQYKPMGQSESVTLYQMDKDDRPQLKVSVINTLDANGRVISWNSGNGSRQQVIQIPLSIAVKPNSCLNSQEMLVVTWDTQSLFVVDFSSPNNVSSNAQALQLASGNSLAQCVNDKLNRRFLLANTQGVIFSYDIQTKKFVQLFQLNSFSSLQSIFPTQNTIAISYAQISGQSYAVSYINSTLQFSQTLPKVSTQILVNKQEDQVVIIGNSNLFQVWNIKLNQKVYQPNFQQIKCDQKDANQTSVDSSISFTFGSINQNDEIAVVSNNYVFAYSMSQQKPLLFKSQNFGVYLIQAFVLQNKIILNQQYSVANFDLLISKYLYVTNVFPSYKSSYDVITKIEIDSNLNRIIRIDLGGKIQYWSILDNIEDNFIFYMPTNSTFFIDRQLNKMVQFSYQTNSGGLNQLLVYDYLQGTLIDRLNNPFTSSDSQVYQAYQDKTNGYIVGFILENTCYTIYKFNKNLDHSMVFKGVLINNAKINGPIILLESSQQMLVQINQKLYLFNYFYSSGNQNQPISFQGSDAIISQYFFISSTNQLVTTQQQAIQIYNYNSNQLSLTNSISYYTGSSISISLVQEQQIIILNRGNQLFLKNYQTMQENILDFVDQSVLMYTYDGPRALLIIILANFKIEVINIAQAKVLYLLQLNNNALQMMDIFPQYNLVVVSYQNGQVIYYNYITNNILSIFNNQFFNNLEQLDSRSNSLVLKSNLKIFTRRMTNLGLINQIQEQVAINSYFIDIKSGLSFTLTDKVKIFNHLTQQYLPNFNSNINYTPYIIYSIPSQNWLFLGFQNSTVNLAYVYRLDNYQQIAILDHNITQCNLIKKIYHDVKMNRLFSACKTPGTVVVWDLNNNFTLIQSMLNANPTQVSSISFNQNLGIITMMGLSWWSSTFDYNTLNYKCQVVGIYSNFDYTNKYQVTWDQNGDFRLYDYKCTQIAYRHCAKSWINQLIIDEQQMIITTISQDNKVKTYNYQILPNPALLNQLILPYQLNDGFLDKDNGYLLVADFNGYIYMISYPSLILQQTIQVTSQKINNVYLDKTHNLFLFVSQPAQTISYYNLIEFLQSNAYSVSFRNTGVMSTLSTKQGMIFHQHTNIIQVWDYQNQSLRYGFFVNSQLPQYESQSRFEILLGQDNVSAFMTRDQIIFFNINTFDIIYVQQLKCLRSTQLNNYFICSQVNVLTILNVNSFVQSQTIQLQQSSVVIQLQSILEINTFFVTTSQGEIIFFTLDNNQNIFQQQLYSQLLTQAIANYCFIRLNQNYMILASSFDGQIGQMVLSQKLNILNQQKLPLPGLSSHAHVMLQFNNQIFIKRILDFSLIIYNSNDFTQFSTLPSPCIGYSYKLDINQDYDLIIQSCIGNYQINQLSSLKNVATGRYIANLNLTEYVYTPDCNQIVYINKDYFIDAYFTTIFIYQIDYANQIVKQLGNFQLGDIVLGSIASYNTFSSTDNIYVQLILYSQDTISQVQLPIFGEKSCQQSLSSSQFGEVVLSVQSVYQQIQTYFQIQSIQFNVIIDQETILLPFPSFQFSAITQISIVADQTKTTKQKIIVNEEIFFSFSGYNLISLNNLYIEPASSQKDYLLFNIQNLTQFQLNNVQLGNEKLFSFNFNYIESVVFDQLQILNMTQSASNIVTIFNFQQVNNMIFNQINVSQSNFSQINLFYFQNDVNNNKSLIRFQDLQIQQSEFLFRDDTPSTSTIFISNYNNVSFDRVNINQNSGTSIPLIKSYVVSNLTLSNIKFTNNKEIMLLSYNSSISQVIAKVALNQQLLEDNIRIWVINISSNQYSLFSKYSIVQINSLKQKISKADINNNIDLNSSNQILNLKAYYLNCTNATFIQNQGFQNLFFVPNTQLGNFQNLVVWNNQAAQSILLLSSKVQISNSSVKENISNNKLFQTSVINILSNSQVSLSSSEFESNQSFLGGSIYVSQSDLQIEQVSFKNDISQNQGGSIYSIQSTLSLRQSQFTNCSSDLGGSIYIQKGSIQLNSVNSSKSTSNQDGGFLYASGIEQFILSNLNLQDCIAFNDGGCIYLTSSGGNSSSITQSLIQNSQAFGSGGAILLDNTDLSINQTQFVNNTAGIGGAIRYLNLKPHFLIQNSNSSKDSCKTFSQNHCQQNKAIIFGNSIASYPQYASILPSNDFKVNIDHYPNVTLSNFRSGMSSFDFSVQFLDEFKNLVQQINLQDQTLTQSLSQKLIQEISQYNCRVQINQISTSLEEETIKIDGATLVDYAYHGKNKIGCLMNNFKITGIPTKSGLISLQLNGMKSLYGSNQFSNITDIQINVQFRECQVGEYYTSTCDGCQLYECTQCLNGTYSLEEPKIGKSIECKTCDTSQTNSCFLNQIVLKQNYWRVSNQSDQIFFCNSNNCNGNESKGYCIEGYVGALCSSCDNYGKIWGIQYGQSQVGSQGIQCIRCDQIKDNAYKQILVLLSVLFYLGFLIVESQNNNCKMCQIRILSSINVIQFGISQFILQSSVISKIFINQFYIITSLKENLQVSFPDLFSFLFTFPEVASQPVLVFLYSLDCSLSSIHTQIPIQYLRFIYISIVLPLTFLILIYIMMKLIIHILNYVKPKEAYYSEIKYNNVNMLISTLIVFTYLASQNIYQAALQIVFCQKFDNQYYMKSQMDQQCYTQEHIFYIIFLVLPVLILVTVIYPLVMLYILCKNSSKLFDNTSTNVIRRYGYFFQGYKKNRWWWELLKTEYKFIELLLATYFTSQPVNQLISIIFVQLVYCALLTYFSPYQDNKINILELKSSILTLLIFWLSLFIQLNSNMITLTQIASALLVTTMIILFEWVKKYVFKNYWILYNLIYKNDYNPFATFNNWRKLRNIFLKGDFKIIEIQKLQNRISKQSVSNLNSSPRQKSNFFGENSQNSLIKTNSIGNKNNDFILEDTLLKDNSPIQNQVKRSSQFYKQLEFQKIINL